MEIFLIATWIALIAVIITDARQKRRAYLCQRVEVAEHKPAIRK